MSRNPPALSLYSIDAGIPFAASLAAGLLEKSKDDIGTLARYRILLPTRRACRNLQETFLRLTGGKPLLLPRMQPIGDVEEDELVLDMAGMSAESPFLDLPPAISPMRRRILLARAIMKLPRYTRGAGQDFALAGTLGRLMDQVYTEGLDLSRLPDLIDDETLAGHWQITVEFLEILSDLWPRILAEQGVIDAADRRVRLMDALAAHWQESPPGTPVFAAGSTGSIPATARLLKVVAGLPEGSVVLPGLDRILDEESWEALDDTHPQATLKQLLHRMGVSRAAVKPWPYAPPAGGTAEEPSTLKEKKHAARLWFSSEIMRPAATVNRWQGIRLDEERKAMLCRSLADVKRFECDTAQEEAQLIAFLMRETLEAQESTAALVTPDRTLARRVASICQRWGIVVDDSGGQLLDETPIGSFLRLIGACVLGDFRPAVLVSLLKHEFFHLSLDKKRVEEYVSSLERRVLRGAVFSRGLKGICEAAKGGGDDSFLGALEEAFRRFSGLCAATVPFSEILDSHIDLAQALARLPDGTDFLWRGEAGEAAALFLSDLRDHADILPEVDGRAYIDILEQLIHTVSVRSPCGAHPRLSILGQLEARLIQADLVILGGLNEGTWPPGSGDDPWMSRPMRKKFGLPSQERAIGLAAHDFIQGFCAPRVAMTRARRAGNAPSVPARWLQRLDTVMQAAGLEKEDFAHGYYREWIAALDTPEDDFCPAPRPKPCPPVSKRPQALYVTAIEKWMRDPYSIYARHILGLYKLRDLEEQAGAAERGEKMHAVLDRFIRKYPDTLPEDALPSLIAMGREELAPFLEEPRLWGFWWPRFERLSRWFIEHEEKWRREARPQATEIKGSLALDVDGIPFTLSARADRIDLCAGGYAVIDYKTGQAPSANDVKKGIAPQLPLEGLILAEGGFEGLAPRDVAYLGFWVMNGGATPGDEKAVDADIDEARNGLMRLIRVFRDPGTPYYSLPNPRKAPNPAFQDYAHLARVQEWSVLDESGAEEAA